MILSIFITLLILLLNEFRLIKKYVKAHENNFKKTNIQKAIQFLATPFIALKNWINYKLVNNELNH